MSGFIPSFDDTAFAHFKNSLSGPYSATASNALEGTSRFKSCELIVLFPASPPVWAFPDRTPLFHTETDMVRLVPDSTAVLLLHSVLPLRVLLSYLHKILSPQLNQINQMPRL